MRASVVLTLSGLLMRLAFLPEGPEGWDAVDFVLALDSYDMSRFQPHFPGYPLYVVLGKLAAALGLSPETALRSVNATAGALLPLPLAALLGGGERREVGNEKGRGRAGYSILPFAASCVPALLLASVGIESDLPAIVVVLFSMQAASASRPGLAGMIAGLALGFRPGVIPLVLGVGLWLVIDRTAAGSRWRAAIRFAGGIAVGSLLWLIPQLGVTGASYFREASYFVAGHFSDWGETAFTRADPGERLWTIARRISHGLGVDLSPDLVSMAIAVLLAIGVMLWIFGGRRREDAWIGYIAVPQAIVVAIFQNPDRTRHSYPLILALAVLALLGWARCRRPIGRIGWLVGLVLVSRGLFLLHERATTLPPALACAREVMNRDWARETWVFCGESSRFFDLEGTAETLLVLRARDFDGVRQEVNMRPLVPENVVVFSEVPGQESRAPIFTARESPLVYDNNVSELYLYHAVQDPAQRYVSLRPVSNASGPSAPAKGPAR